MAWIFFFLYTTHDMAIHPKNSGQFFIFLEDGSKASSYQRLAKVS
jgi:hypothetical protein